MELRHLRYFVFVAEELHFGRAAERAGIAQPPLSQQIRSLEAELGVQLFTRTNRRVSLTDAGSALLPEARRLLRDADRAASIVREAADGWTGHVRIGFVASAAFGWIPQMMETIRHRYPGIQVSLRELTSEQQRSAIQSGQIDLGLVRYPIHDEAVVSAPFASERLVVAHPTSPPPRWTTSRVSAGDLGAYPLILFPREYGPPLYDQIMQLLIDAGVTPDVGQEAVQMTTIVALVAAKIGIAIVPESVARIRPEGVSFTPLIAVDGSWPSTHLHLAARRDEHSRVVNNVIEALEETQSSV